METRTEIKVWIRESFEMGKEGLDDKWLEA